MVRASSTGRDRISNLELAIAERIDREQLEALGEEGYWPLGPVRDIISFHVEHQAQFEKNANRLPSLARDLAQLQTAIERILDRLPRLSPALWHQSMTRLYRLAIEYAERLKSERRHVGDDVDFDFLADLAAVAERVLAQHSGESSAQRALVEAEGTLSEADLAEEFSSQYQQELNQAVWFRRSAIVLLIATTLALGALTIGQEGLTTEATLRKLGLGIPAATLFGYLSAQARHHRQTAQDHADVALRLSTIGAYSQRLDQQRREELLVHFGKSLFIADPSRRASATTEHQGSDSELAEAIRELRNSLRTEAPAPPAGSP